MGVDCDEGVIAAEIRKNVAGRYFSWLNLIDHPLPSEPNGYDWVLSTHTLSHIPDESKATVLDKLVNAVRPNGWLIIQVDRNDNISFNWLKSKTNIKRSVSYRGWVSDVMERYLPEKVHMNGVVRRASNMLSYVDFGSLKNDRVMLVRKHTN